MQSSSLAGTKHADWARVRALHARSTHVGRFLLALGMRDTSNESVFLALSRAQALSPGSADGVSHASYLERLRVGARKVGDIHRAQRFVLQRQESKARRGSMKLRMAQHAIAATHRGDVTLEVTHELELGALERWQQGDQSLYTDDNLDKRALLRKHPRVRAALQVWWEAAVLSTLPHHPGRMANMLPDDYTGLTIGFDEYAAVFGRLYRVVIKEYDQEEAAACLKEDCARGPPI